MECDYSSIFLFQLQCHWTAFVIKANYLRDEVCERRLEHYRLYIQYSLAVGKNDNEVHVCLPRVGPQVNYLLQVTQYHMASLWQKWQ